jgi:hypothetical protein
MHCVDSRLQPAGTSANWDEFAKRSFVCHACEKIFKGSSDHLYFVRDMDFLFHKHDDGTYHRALEIMDNGSVRIGAIDSEKENVLQRYAFRLDGQGRVSMIGSTEDLRAQSRRFFESMRRQKRAVVQGEISTRFR